VPERRLTSTYRARYSGINREVVDHQQEIEVHEPKERVALEQVEVAGDGLWGGLSRKTMAWSG